MKSLFVLGLLFTLLLSLGAVTHQRASSPARAAHRQACATQPGAVTSRYAYRWPVKPFGCQHPIRGAFGDPRTMAREQPFGVTAPGDSGSYAFHGGVDIVAKPGTPVYPVVSGVVVRAGEHGIIVHSPHVRSFQYWHLRRNVRLGQHVVAEHTVLGWIQKPFDHVHLQEIDHYRVQNPLARGHLEPYADHTAPHAIALVKRNGKLGIEAVDTPATRVPGPWAGLPQTPALVEWRLRAGGRAWSGWHTAADVRNTEPPNAHFWDVYLAGTYQNVPVFDHRLFQRVAGRYLFRVGLDLSLLRQGRYKLEARVADIRGNSSTTTWSIEIPGN